jgi:hypothetical protein
MAVKVKILPETFKLEKKNDRFNVDFFTVDRNVSIICEKGGSVSFQTAIVCDGEYILNIGTRDVFSQMGDRKKLRISIDCVFPVTCNLIGMHTDDDLASRADILLSQETEEYQADEVSCIYCELFVPKHAKAGIYSGTIRLYGSNNLSDEEKMFEQSFTFEVVNLVKKEAKENRFYLDLWQHLSNIARKHETPLWSDAHFEVIEAYVKTLAALGQKAVTLIVSEIPWNGQNCAQRAVKNGNLYEYSIVNIRRNYDGIFTYDFSVMQRYIDLCKKYGIDRELSLYGLTNIWGEDSLADDYPDKIKLRYLDESDGLYKYIRNATEIDRFLRALEQYFIQTKQIGQVRVVADEPANIEAYRNSINHLLQIAPSFQLKAAINHADFIGEFGNEVMDFVPSLGCVSAEYDKLKQYQKEMDGKRFLWYVCCAPAYPNTFLSSDLCESLFIGVLTSYLNFDGFLRWNYTVWPDDPRKEIRYGEWKAGDTNFVYPANNGTPLVSLRYKALLRAIELFELLEELKRVEDTEALAKAYSFVVKEKDIRCYFAEDPHAIRLPLSDLCSLNYNDYMEMKKYLLHKLSKKGE